MSWAEVKKINTNMDVPLNRLFGTKINEHTEDYVEVLDMDYDSEYMADYSNIIKSKFYNRIWEKNNVIADIKNGITYNIPTYTRIHGYGNFLVGTKGLYVITTPTYGGANASACFKLVNLFDNGKEWDIFKFEHSVNVDGDFLCNYFRISEHKLIITFDYYQTTASEFRSKVILVEFNEDGDSLTSTILVNKQMPYTSSTISKSNSQYACFLCGKYVEVSTGWSCETGSSSRYADYRHLIDLESKTVVTSSANLNANRPAHQHLVTSKYFETNCVKINSYTPNDFNHFKTSTDKKRLSCSFNEKYLYDKNENIFTMLTIDNTQYYDNNYYTSSYDGILDQDIIKVSFKAEYSETQDKIVVSDYSTTKILGSCFSIVSHYSKDYCIWGNDLQYIRIIGDDAICIPPYLCKGINGTLHSPTTGAYETHVKYKDDVYRPYIIRNISSDNPTVEYLDIPWLKELDNWAINECLVNYILGLGLYWGNSTSSYYKYLQTAIYNSMFNVSSNRLAIYSCDDARNHSGRLMLSYENTNTSSASIDLYLKGSVMFSKEFNTVDEFLDVFNELFLLSIRNIPVMKGMKVVFDTRYVLNVEGVPVSRDEDEPNILQIEKTGILKIKMASAKPDENNPIMLTF